MSILETQTLDSAAALLDGRLPEDWSVRLDSRRRTLIVAPPRGPDAAFAIAAHRYQTVDAIIDQMKALRTADQPVVCVTEYVNPPLRQACEALGFGYLDTTGWVYLVHDEPALFLRMEGAARPPRPRANNATKRLNGPAAVRIIGTLLETTPPVRVRALAAASRGSAAAVSKLLHELTAAGAVDRGDDGAITAVRKRTLLDRWIADYSFLGTNKPAAHFLAPRGVDRALTAARDQPEIRITGSAAARTHLPPGTTSVVPFGLLAVYAVDHKGVAAALGLIPVDPHQANVVMATPVDGTVFQSPAVRLGQVLADLLTLPGRSTEEAEQLIDTLATHDPDWTR